MSKHISLVLAVSLLAACGGRQGEQAATEESPGGATEAMEGEESGKLLAKGDAFDQERAGTRLTLSYDAGANAFAGTVENVSGAALSQVRVEVHLSNGMELGPTPPVDLRPGAKADVRLAAPAEAFETWSAHAEVGGGEHGEAHEGQGDGEHGEGRAGPESGNGEHGGDGEKAGSANRRGVAAERDAEASAARNAPDPS